MKQFLFTRQFEKSFAKLPDDIAGLFEKKLPLFLKDTSHPSFRVKKMEGFRDPSIWEASLTINYRFTFETGRDGTIVFRYIGTHNILERKKV